MATQQGNPELTPEAAKNLRIVRGFLMGLNVVTIVAVALSFGLKFYWPHLGGTLILLLFFWNWSGYRILQKLKRGEPF